MDNNTSNQDDEINALNSIYGDDWKMECESGKNFSLNLREGVREVTLFFHLPEAYPAESPPGFELSAPSLTREQKDNIIQALNNVYLDNLGEAVLYQWIEKVREILQSLPDISEVHHHKEGPQALHPIQEKVPCPPIVHGEVIEDRKSRFQAHVAKINSSEEVNAVVWNLKLERKIASATHNIVAWRCGNQHDFDDDGESAAGGRLLKLLEVLRLNNVIVVVTRWYGGIHLGSDRFRHINNAARQALVQAEMITR